MGSLIVKLDAPTQERLKRRHHYSDVDMLEYKGPVVGRNGVDLLEVPMVVDVDAVKVSIRNILMWRVGESVLRPEFGHNLKLSMYSQMNQFNQDQICEEIKRAIEENEPRARVETVAVKREDEDGGSDSKQSNALHVRVVYSVVGGNGGEDARFEEQTTISGR